MSTIWKVVRPAGEDAPAFIETVTKDGSVIGAEINPSTTTYILEFLQAARDEDAKQNMLPRRAGWRSREKLQAAVAKRTGYPVLLETISRYISDLLRALEQSAAENRLTRDPDKGECNERDEQDELRVPPLIQRRRHLGMRLADGVQIIFTDD